MLEDLTQLAKEAPDTLAVCLCTDSALLEPLNQLARSYWNDKKLLSSRVVHKIRITNNQWKTFAVGEQIQFTQPNPSLGITPGSFGRITAIRNSKISVELFQPGTTTRRLVKWDLGDYHHFDYGYVVRPESLPKNSIGRANWFMTKHWDASALQKALENSVAIHALYTNQADFPSIDALKAAIEPKPLEPSIGVTKKPESGHNPSYYEDPDFKPH